MKALIEEYIHSSAHLSKKHVHPKLAKLFEMGGLNTVFERAEGQYLYDMEGQRYLDFLGGGGVFLLGRNHPKVKQALRDVLELDLPNLCVVNASVLGGLLAEKLINVSNPDHFSKVLLANSGTESTDMSLRFARFVTGRRRFLYLEGAFHGRTYAAVSVCGSEALREGMEPLMPVCTPIPANDLAALRRELRRGDVAGFIFEPVQGMTLDVLDPGYMREAEILCRKHGTVMIADEVQTGLCRTGDWFVTTAHGIRPDLLTTSKILSGGQVPVSAVLMSEELYQRIFNKFKAGPIYFSTFAENNLSMAGAIACIDALDEMNAAQRARELGDLLRSGVEKLAETYDVIDTVKGRGLMMGIFFRQSGDIKLKLQQKILDTAERGAFGAAVNVDMYGKHRIICQIPGPGLDAIKILPPVVSTEEDVQAFLEGLEDTLASFYTDQGPIRSISRGFVKEATKTLSGVLPKGLSNFMSGARGDEKKKTAPQPAGMSPSDTPTRGSITARNDKGILEFGDYRGDITEHADVVIVGSGPGGALAARALAAGGRRVIVLEAGPRLKPADFGTDVGETFSKYFWEGGLRATRGNVMMPSLHGRVLGGGSVFNSAICMRMPEWQAHRWREEYGIEGLDVETMRPHFDEMASFLEISTTENAILGKRNELFLLGGSRMGYDPTPIERNTVDCRGSANCINGCQNGAKLSMDRRGLPEAINDGARVYTSVLVDRLIVRGNRIAGVTGHTIDPETGKKTAEVRITARATILAAGAFATPVIMLKSGLKNPNIGKNMRAHPGSLVLGRFDDDVQPWSGATQGAHVTKFLREGIKLESAWTATSLFASNFRGAGSKFTDAIRDFKHMASWDIWTSGDDSIGSIRVLPGGMVDARYDLGYGDARRMHEGLAMLCDMFFAAGATEVFTNMKEPFSVMYDTDDVTKFRRASFEPADFATASNHIFGTTTMGADPESHVCASDTSVYGVDDLYVCDTGVFPGSPGANPMMTMWAFANKIGQELAVRYG